MERGRRDHPADRAALAVHVHHLVRRDPLVVVADRHQPQESLVVDVLDEEPELVDVRRQQQRRRALGPVPGDDQAAERVPPGLAVVAAVERLKDGLDDGLLGARRPLDGVQPAQQVEQRHQPRSARLTAARAWPAPTRSGAIASACW